MLSLALSSAPHSGPEVKFLTKPEAYIVSCSLSQLGSKWKKFFVPCCETPGKPCLQVPLSVLHVSGSLLQRTKSCCRFVRHLPQRGPGVGLCLRVKCKASRGYSAEEFCPASLHQSCWKVFSAVVHCYHSFSAHTSFRCSSSIFYKLLILL